MRASLISLACILRVGCLQANYETIRIKNHVLSNSSQRRALKVEVSAGGGVTPSVIFEVKRKANSSTRGIEMGGPDHEFWKYDAAAAEA